MTACAECGSPMVQPVALLNVDGRCERMSLGEPVCSGEACTARRRAEDRADQAARDDAAMAKAIAAGVIDP